MTTIASDLPDRSPSISSWITFLLALSCGLIVANIYYAQPLVGPIAAELGLSPKAAGLVMTMTQLGYGVGLFLIVPLYLFWAFLASYDLRTAYVFFPWLAMLAGIALARIAGMGEPRLMIFCLISYLLLAEAYALHPEIDHPAHPAVMIAKYLIPFSWNSGRIASLQCLRGRKTSR